MPRAKKQVQEPKTNGMAVASFVLGLCGLITFGFTTMIGFVLGIVALVQIKDRGERGGGLAVTAVALGGILIALFLIGLAVG